MPLLLSKSITAASSYAVWNIQETNDQLKKLCVGVELPEYADDTRLAEWMVGRILVKTLCEHYGIKYTGVQKLESGKPVLKSDNAHISISHSFPMAAAQIDLHKPCGIDMERARLKLIAIQKKFINEQEKGYLNDLTKLTVAWCGKEALYKVHGRQQLSMKDHTTVAIESASTMTGIIHQTEELRYNLRYERVKDYFLAYTY